MLVILLSVLFNLRYTATKAVNDVTIPSQVLQLMKLQPLLMTMALHYVKRWLIRDKHQKDCLKLILAIFRLYRAKQHSAYAWAW